jgi:hypothetical protein
MLLGRCGGWKTLLKHSPELANKPAYKSTSADLLDKACFVVANGESSAIFL